MAFSPPLSSSLKKGQVVLQCQLCENDPKLKWKCLDCGLMMCQRCCDKVHPKFPSADDHTVIDIKDISKHQTDSDLKPDLTKLKCEVHSEQNCCFYCETCESLLCHICVIKTHKKHEFGEIIDEYNIRIKKMKDGQKIIKKGLQNLTVSEQKLKQVKATEKSNYEHVKQEILDYEKALMDEIKKQTNKHLQELDQRWETVSNLLDNKEKTLKENRRQIQDLLREVNNLLQPGNAKNVFSVPESLSNAMETEVPPVNTSFTGVPEFQHGDITKIPLGTLKDAVIQCNTVLHAEKKFKTDLTIITSLVSNPDGSFWIFDEDLFKKVETNGDDLNILTNFKLSINNAALLPSKDLLLCVEGSSYLKLIPHGSTDIKDSVYTVAPLLPFGVRVIRDKVMVVAVDSEKIPATGPRQVIVMDQTGQHEKVIQYDRNDKPLFVVPLRIASMINHNRSNIAVVDMVSGDGSGRVVILDEDGEVRNMYTGHPDVNNESSPFQPFGITTSPKENFVVTDMSNTLHILNCDGEIITYYNTQEIGILLPWSVSFSITGQLYIGCSNDADSKRKVDRAEIVGVKNFIF